MVCKIKNIMPGLSLNVSAVILFLVMQLFAQHVFAQDKVATIKLSFIKTDSSNICKATVMSDSSLPVKETKVHFYLQRMYSLLPIGKVVATDENGEAEIDFPMDLHGDKNGMLDIFAKIENDDNYANVETEAAVKWGAISKPGSSLFSDRSLSASREKAPMFLVVASTLIIVIIWGTLFYVIYQLFRIRRSGRQEKKLSIA